MKKVLLALFVLAITACSSESETAEGIEGRWYFSKVGIFQNGQELVHDYDGNAAGCTRDNLVFRSNGTYIYNDYQSVTVECQLVQNEGTYTITESDFTLTANGMTNTGFVYAQTDDVLKLVFDDGRLFIFNRH